MRWLATQVSAAAWQRATSRRVGEVARQHVLPQHPKPERGARRAPVTARLVDHPATRWPRPPRAGLSVDLQTAINATVNKRVLPAVSFGEKVVANQRFDRVDATYLAGATRVGLDVIAAGVVTE